MVSEIPWASVVANLDNPPNRSATAESLTQTINVIPEPGRLAVVSEIAPLIATLQTPEGRVLGLSIAGSFADTVSAVRKVATDLSFDGDSSVRSAAVSVLGRVTEDDAARARLFAMLADDAFEVRDLVIRILPKLAQAASEQGDQIAVSVIPDDDSREQALTVLAELERAVRVLQDLGLDDAQHRIVDELIDPAISELRHLLGSASTEPEELQNRRKQSALRIGTLTGAAKALAVAVPATTTVLATADDAAANVSRAADALYPIADLIISFLSHPF